MALWLGFFTTVVGPALGVLIKLLVQFKVLRTEAQIAEAERRLQAALQQADDAKNAATSARKQYEAAKSETEKKWKEQFGSGSDMR